MYMYSNVAINPTVDWKVGIPREKCGGRGGLTTTILVGGVGGEKDSVC